MMSTERALVESDLRGAIAIPSCPNCHSKTGLSYENPGARLYVCRDCAYPWDSELRGTLPPMKGD